MKYVVDIQTPAAGALEDDNLKGERRWERQATRALLSHNRPVGSVRDSWASPDSAFWQGVTDPTGCALITQADPGNVRYKPGAAAFVSNVFCGLTDECEQEVRRAVREMGRERVALTHSFQVHVALKRLPEDLHDLIYWLPAPAVPRVRRDIDTFRNKTLLWSARAIDFRMRNVLPAIVNLLAWIRGCLQEDPALVFEVLASEERMSQEEADRWVWSFPAFEAAFRDVRGQVRIHPSISWSEVMKIYERTKLAVNDPTPFGGPPVEVASFGIPVPGVACSLFHTTSSEMAKWRQAAGYNDGHNAPVPAFPELVVVGDIGDGFGGLGTTLVDILDRWYRDEASYKKAGDALRNFVEETYTYAAFVKKLDALPAFRGLL